MSTCKNHHTIGIVGGLSPESTVKYYHHIIQKHQEKFHSHSYPRIVISSVCFQNYVDWQHSNDWHSVAAGLAAEFQSLKLAGADFGLVAANTMHKVLPQISSPLPILSVIDVVSYFARAQGIKNIGLTGTKFTMNDGFYANGLIKNGINVVLPTQQDQETIHEIIFKELVFGKVVSSSIERFAETVQQLIKNGADAVLLGCTELQMLTNTDQLRLKTIDSLQLHADAAWEIAINGDLKHPMLSHPS